jgi:hypothetical protein
MGQRTGHAFAGLMGMWTIVLFGVSMILPAILDGNPSDRVYGFQLAGLSFIGTLEGLPICVLGLFANVWFVVAYIIFLVFRRRGSRVLFWTALPAPLAMLGSYLWLIGGRFMDRIPDVGFVVWCMSGVMLTWSGWKLRYRPLVNEPRGFEVLPARPSPPRGV